MNILLDIEDDPYPTNIPKFVISHLLIFPIDGHGNHEIVSLIHRQYTKRYIFKLSKRCIQAPHLLFCEVNLDIVTIYIVWPLPSIIGYSGSIDALIFDVHQSLTETKSESNITIFPVR